MAGEGGAAAGGAANKEEEPGMLSKIGSAIASFFMLIFEAVFFVVKKIYELICLIVAFFRFLWYPIKERCKGCCRWCEKRKNRSQDPNYSTFDNEV